MKMKRKILRTHFYLVLLATLTWACNAQPAKKMAKSDVYEGIEFDMPQIPEPEFPDYSVTISDYGAIGDGQTLNTEAFEAAIKAVAENGGGRVVIPRGIWLTGPIVLKSNIDLHAEAGALVIFSKDKDLYPLVKTSFEGLNTVRCMSPIYGKDLKNIAITGEGIFDGSGEVWRLVKRSKLTSSQWKELVASGGFVDEKGDNWYPSESFMKGMRMSDMNVPTHLKTMEDYAEIKDFLRPVMVSLVNCKTVLLEGPVFQNSPAWCIHPLMCENLIVRNTTVRNPWFSQNGDGIDIESCKNSLVYNCSFDVGDDAICIKSGKDEDGRKRGIATENLIIKNCIVFHGHGGVTVGSEMSGDVRNMHVSACTFIGTDVGLRFKSNRGRGGVVEKIYMSDIDMINIPTNAISFNLYYGGFSVLEMLENESDESGETKAIPEVTEETPQFKDISMKNITCKGARQAIYLQGLPEMALENVYMENLVMEAEKGLFCMDANGITINNLYLKTEDFPALKIYNSKNVSVDGVTCSDSEKPLFLVAGERTEGIKFNVDTGKGKDELLILEGNVNPEVVAINKE